MTFFGDVGGFSGFLLAAIGLLIGSIPGKLFEIGKAEDLFRANLQFRSNKNKLGKYETRND